MFIVRETVYADQGFLRGRRAEVGWASFGNHGPGDTAGTQGVNRGRGPGVVTLPGRAGSAHLRSRPDRGASRCRRRAGNKRAFRFVPSVSGAGGYAYHTRVQRGAPGAKAG